MVKTLEFSPDGAYLASGGSDSLIQIQEASTGQIQHTLKGHRNTIYDLAWSVAGDQLASAAFDRTARVWNL
jgi:WD40 repeat protein